MEYFDLGIRTATIAILALIAALMATSRIGVEGRISILAVALSKSSFLLVTSAIELPFPAIVEDNLFLLASLTPNALTWLIVTIFVDPPGRRWPWFVASSIVSAALYLHFVMPGIGAYCAALAVPLYGALLGLSIWNARGDLVECRCHARPAFATAIAGLALFLTAIQAFGVAEPGAPLLAILQAVATFGVSFALAARLLRPDLKIWPGPQDSAPAPQVRPEHDPDSPLMSRIRTAMQAGIWREEGLTIGRLASRLSVPEHRLRRTINQGLGHRNFSSFVNAARIDAARRMLSDPAEADTTILQIAYGVGFASLGPFNRAFRAETGMSPTEYRREAMRGPVNSEMSTPILPDPH